MSSMRPPRTRPTPESGGDGRCGGGWEDVGWMLRTVVGGGGGSGGIEVGRKSKASRCSYPLMDVSVLLQHMEGYLE